ncbi:MAG: hypothetical protein ABR616_05800 [Dermatophilaceae bacterium]
MFGWDPIHLLSLSGADRVLAQAVIQDANELQNEKDAHHMKAMQVAVQNGVARAFKK